MMKRRTLLRTYRFTLLSIASTVLVLFSVGTLLYNARSLELLVWFLFVCGGVVLYAGLQCWLYPRPKYFVSQDDLMIAAYGGAVAQGVLDREGSDSDSEDGSRRERRRQDLHDGDDDDDVYARDLLYGDEAEYDEQEQLLDQLQDYTDVDTTKPCFTGMRVCALVGLALFGAATILTITYVLFRMHVNSPHRVAWGRVDEPSPALLTSVMPNGARLSLARSTYKRGKFSVVLRVGVGSFEEGKQPGLAFLAQGLSTEAATLAFPRGVEAEFASMGVGIRSSTHHRSTVYEVTDVDLNQENLEKTLHLLREAALAQDPQPASVTLQKALARGQERLLNSTSSFLSRRVYCNHFGMDSRTCTSFAFSDKQRTEDYTAQQVARFYDTWYHPERCQLFLAGDFESMPAVNRTVWAQWSQARRANGGAGLGRGQPATPEAPKPEEAYSIQALPGVGGLELKLVVSMPYAGGQGPRTSNHHRREVLDAIFYGALLNQYLERLTQYEEEGSTQLYDSVELHTDVKESYDLGQTLHLLHFKILDHPEKGSWRRGLEVFLLELRRLAVLGPDPHIITELMEAARSLLEARMAYSSFDSSSKLVELIQGNSDPRFVYQDAAQLYATQQQFLDSGFVDAAGIHVQTEAQFLFKHLVQSVNGSHPFLQEPFDQLVNATGSVTILTDEVKGRGNGNDDDGGASGTRTSLAQLGEGGGDAEGDGGSYVSKQDVSLLLNKVLDAVLLSRPSVSMIRMREALLSNDRWRQGWEQRLAGGDYAARGRGEDESVMQRVGTILTANFEQAGAAAQGGSMAGGSGGLGIDSLDEAGMDGLPSSGSLVDSERLFVPSGSSGSSPGAGFSFTASGGHELVDSFPLSGVKRYRLGNGLRVNVKRRMSGSDELPCDAPGTVEMEVVSLGGRGAQPAFLKGACELVDTNVASGYSVGYWPRSGRVEESGSGTNGDKHKNDDADLPQDQQQPGGSSSDWGSVEEVYFDKATVEEYAGGRSAWPKLVCEKEHLVLRKRLHARCVNYPVPKNCESVRARYWKPLEAVRLALSPVYDANSVEAGARAYKELLTQAEKTASPEEYIRWRLQWQLHRPWLRPDQTEVIRPSDLRALDAVKVTQWVREQFTVDRMEINVVGDFDEALLLRQLNRMLGTMPLLPAGSHSSASVSGSSQSPSPRTSPLVAALQPAPALLETASRGRRGSLAKQRQQQQQQPPQGQASPQKQGALATDKATSGSDTGDKGQGSIKRVGHDIYDPDHAVFFRLSQWLHITQPNPTNASLPAIRVSVLDGVEEPLLSSEQQSDADKEKEEGKHSSSNCTLAGLHPDRAFIAMAILTSADYSSARGHARAVLADALFKRTVTNTLTRELGLAYTVDAKHVTSQLFRRFGYYQLMWCVGLDGFGAPMINATDARGQPTLAPDRRFAVRQSIAAVMALLSKDQPFGEETFQQTKAGLESLLRSDLQESAAWLSVLRGVSLAPPVWHRTAAQFSAVKDISQTAVLSGLQSLTLAEVTEYFQRHLLAPYSGLIDAVNVAIVETSLASAVNPVSEGSSGNEEQDKEQQEEAEGSGKPAPDPETEQARIDAARRAASVLGGLPCEWGEDE